jgi:hypothetical protein
MNSWFECRVNYDKAGDEGLATRVTESYLVDAVNFTEAEKRITQEIEPFVTGDFMVASIRKVIIRELFDSQEETDDCWWKAKVMLTVIDEEKDVEKLIATVVYVKAADINRAIEHIDNQMQSSVYQYRVTNITETPIMDVYYYEANTEKA